MPVGALTATLPDDLALNVAVLYVGASIAGTTVSGTKVSATQGGIDFKPGIKRRSIEYDGQRSETEGLSYVIEYDARITGSIIQLGASQIAMLEPGSTSDESGGITTYTPIAADTLYEPTDDYLTDVMAVWQRGNGGLFVVHFPKAMVMDWSIDSKDKSEAKVKLDLKAILDLDAAVADTGAAPYTILDVAA
jgi:hypothetical protein